MPQVMNWLSRHPATVVWIWWPQVLMFIVGGVLLSLIGSANRFFDLSTWHVVESTPIHLTVLLVWGTWLACGLIVFNTWGFLIDLASMEPRPKSPVLTTGLCVVSMGLAAAWWGFLNLSVRENLLAFVPLQMHRELDSMLDDVLIFLIFIVFCVIDWTIIRSIARDVTDPDQRTIRRTSIGALLYVEGPVVLGAVLITAIKLLIASNEAACDLTQTAYRVLGGATADGRQLLGDVYVRGYSSGALLMHVILSQIVFGVVRTREAYECDASSQCGNDEPPGTESWRAVFDRFLSLLRFRMDAKRNDAAKHDDDTSTASATLREGAGGGGEQTSEIGSKDNGREVSERKDQTASEHEHAREDPPDQAVPSTPPR